MKRKKPLKPKDKLAPVDSAGQKLQPLPGETPPAPVSPPLLVPDPSRRRGRPPMFKTEEDVEKVIFEYFDARERNRDPITVTGLALALGTHRKTLCEWAEHPVLGNALKKARAIVEDYNEMRLHHANSTGAIFNLKANFGWRDPQDEAAAKVWNDMLGKLAKVLE